MKVGQKYKVRSWDDMEREFGTAQTGVKHIYHVWHFLLKICVDFVGLL